MATTMPKGGLLIALMGKKKKPIKSEVEESEESDDLELSEDEDMGFDDTARECFDALKEEDFEAFKEALRSAIEIIQSQSDE